jgi:hypothetical protein
MTDLAETSTNIGRYSWCRVGFGFAALACGVLAFHAAGMTAFFLTFDRRLIQFLQKREWLLFVTSVVSWSAFFGSVALVRCWPEPYWRRRSNLLFVVSLLGVVLWGMRHAVPLGLASQEIPLLPWVIQLSVGLRWIWLGLLASLSAEVLLHLGQGGADKLRAGILATIATGVAFWIMTLMLDLFPAFGPPRRGGPRVWFAAWMQFLGFWGLYCAANFSTTIVLLMSARESSTLIRELHSKGLVEEAELWSGRAR